MKEDFEQFYEALNEPSPVSLRINSRKPTRLSPDWEPVPWTTSGYYLGARPIFTTDPLFHAGCYYVQEAASMFLEQIIRSYVHHPVICLDICAAPGGKSTHVSSILPENSLLVSNEVIRSRAQVLRENLIKWGDASVIVTNNDPSDFTRLPCFFDCILADVPCSGEGMFRKDVQAVNEWSPDAVRMCASRQQRIISDIWESLKPGGILIYSTCTYNETENEETICWMQSRFGAEVLPVKVDPEWGITGSEKYDFPVYRFFPGKTKGEGFFIAVVRKPDDNYYSDKRSVQGKIRSVPVPGLRDWVVRPDNFYWETIQQETGLIPGIHQEDYLFLKKKLRIIHRGIQLCTRKGNDYIPDHSLAMSVHFNSGIFPAMEVNEKEALRYLKREAFPEIPPGIPKGYLTVVFDGYPLGFMKHTGSRGNNLYPQEWRIRHIN